MTDPATPAPIASPIPLTTPEGRLLAYACPQCEQGYASVLGESPNCNAKGYLALGWIQFRKERQ